MKVDKRPTPLPTPTSDQRVIRVENLTPVTVVALRTVATIPPPPPAKDPYDQRIKSAHETYDDCALPFALSDIAIALFKDKQQKRAVALVEEIGNTNVVDNIWAEMAELSNDLSFAMRMDDVGHARDVIQEIMKSGKITDWDALFAPIDQDMAEGLEETCIIEAATAALNRKINL